jgi:hypothetical protein
VNDAALASPTRSTSPRSWRSTFASHALAAGVSAFELGRVTGTSVRMIERHYGALLQGSAAAIAGRLDALDDRLGQESATEAEAE